MELNSRTFRNALGSFATGVSVVTTLQGDGKPVGVTVSSLASVSLNPPLVLFCLDKGTAHIDSFRKGGAAAVSILAEGQDEISNRFARRANEKWADFAFERWETGCPIVPGHLAALEGVIDTVYEGGDHLIYLLRVTGLDVAGKGQPLVYFRGAYGKLA